MKTTIKILICLLAVLPFAACTKEINGGLRLVAESMGGAKMSIDGGHSTWATGDMVWINGEGYPVTVDENTGEGTADVTASAPFHGVYPASLLPDNTPMNTSGTTYTLNLPSEYDYTTAGGRQNLESPMVAYAADGQTLLFKHLTAAINVQVVNYYGFTISVDEIVVSSNEYQLCGEKEIDINDVESIAPAAGDNTNNTVTINFNPSSPLTVLAGDSVVVQVPVLPVGNTNKFTVKTHVHKVDQPLVDTTFSRTQNTAHAMGRAKMGYARFVTGGLFTINSNGTKAIISQGNLQYQASTQTWQFAPEQFGSIGDAAGNNVFDETRASQAAWIDLFGWGTSGWDGANNTPYITHYHQPYDYIGTGSNNYGYGYGPNNSYTFTYSLTGDYKNSDWGIFNAISNGGDEAGRWRTPTGGDDGEWLYIFNTRNASTVGGIANARCAKANINGVYGVILFPDEYTQPVGITAPSNINYTSYSAWTNATNLTIQKWYKMEAAGAVFLPCTGYRGYSSNNPTYSANTGYYWSSTYHNASSAKAMSLGGSLNVNSNTYKRIGSFVRLIHEVPID